MKFITQDRSGYKFLAGEKRIMNNEQGMLNLEGGKLLSLSFLVQFSISKFRNNIHQQKLQFEL